MSYRRRRSRSRTPEWGLAIILSSINKFTGDRRSLVPIAQFAPVVPETDIYFFQPDGKVFANSRSVSNLRFKTSLRCILPKMGLVPLRYPGYPRARVRSWITHEIFAKRKSFPTKLQPIKCRFPQTWCCVRGDGYRVTDYVPDHFGNTGDM